MKNFEMAVRNLIDAMEEISTEITANDAVNDYFQKHYNFKDDIDDPVYVLTQYIQDKYC